MSDSPNSNDGLLPASAAALRDTRWLGGGIWGAALIALLVTSWASQRVLSSPYDVGFFAVFNQNNGQYDPNQKLVAATALIITAGIAVTLVAAWWAFARATHALIAALADSNDSEEDAPVTGIWIIPGTGRSPLSDAASYLGVAWALIIVRPAVILTIQAFTG
ncbi:MAG: hypothetical protein AB7N24_06390 [Dehalococcoidia bacterium]